MAIFKKLAWFFKWRWKSYAIVVGLLIICSLLSASLPLIVGNFVDLVANQQLTWTHVWTHAGTVLIIGIVMYIFRYIWRSNLFTNSTLLESTLRMRLYRHFMKMDAEFFDKYRTGDLMAHATNDLNSLKYVAGGGIITFTDSISVTVVTLFSMFVFIDWRLTLITIVPFIVLPLGTRVLSRMINRYYRGALEAFSNMNDHVQESVAGAQVIKSFGEEEATYRQFTEKTNEVVSKNEKAYRVDAGFTPMIQIITALTYGLTLIVGTYFVQNDQITIGDLIAYFNYLGMMVYPLIAVGRLANTLEKGNVSYDRITEVLAEEAQITNPENAYTQIEGEDLQVDIQSFTYPQAESASLENVHFDLQQGESLGLVGPTGSGKSTLLDLLIRHYDVQQGSIKIDGHPIEDYDLWTLNNRVSYVTQQNLLFSTSIRNNIRFGRPDMSQEEVEYYAKLAHIHDDILDFPDGYDTEVGERGVSLSGGQKQRISIARSLAMEPAILLFDDALSAVDAKTEKIILRNLRQHRRDRMNVIAAHRISTVMQADEILVLKNGRVTERGDHDHLLVQEGWYEKMFTQQQLESKLSGEGEDDE